MSWIAVGVGAAALIGGTAMGGSAADKQKNALKKIANTPGLDIEGISAQALGNQQKLLPGATKLVGEEATSRQSLINQLLEQSLPGFTAQRDQALGTAGDFLSGKIPQDVSDLVQRSGAARSLGGGFGGSGMHRNLVARDLGLTSLSMKDKGLSWLSALRGLSPTATPQSALSFTGPGAQDFVNIRGNERAQRMNLLAQRAGIKGQTGMFGDMFQGVGGLLLGSAAGGGGFGGMGGGGGVGGGQTIGYNSSGFIPISGTYYAPGSRPKYTGPELGVETFG